MLIVVMMCRWSADSACRIVHHVRLYSVLDTVVISGEDVCCSVVFATLAGVSVFSVMWSPAFTQCLFPFHLATNSVSNGLKEPSSDARKKHQHRDCISKWGYQTST